MLRAATARCSVCVRDPIICHFGAGKLRSSDSCFPEADNAVLYASPHNNSPVDLTKKTVSQSIKSP